MHATPIPLDGSEMTSRICYLHIGPHKTGSSTLKHLFRANEDALESIGIFFPKSIDEKGRRAGHHAVLVNSRELTREGDLKDDAVLWKEIEQVIAQGRMNILLSSEMFSDAVFKTGRIERLLEYFSKRGYMVVVFAYLRETASWLNSSYVQSQKRLVRQQSFDDYVEMVFREGWADPNRFLAPFIDNPRCRLEPIPFEQVVKVGLEEDFMRRCGVENIDGFIKPPSRNTNAGAKTIYAAQKIMEESGGGVRERKGYAPLYNEFKEKFRRLGWDTQPYIALDSAKAEAIRARLAPSANAFAQRFFDTSWAEVCPSREIKRSFYDPSQASPDEQAEMDEVIKYFVEAFDQRPLKERRIGAGARWRKS